MFTLKKATSEKQPLLQKTDLFEAKVMYFEFANASAIF